MKYTLSLTLLLLPLLAGCASSGAILPSQLTAPTPIEGNSGKYMCPWTSDDVVAPWVERCRKASAGARIGSFIGKELGSRALEQVPFVGGWLGGKAGKAAGRKVAVEIAGGWEYIRGTSDLSFDEFDDLAVYIFVKFSDTEHYAEVLKLASGIYPEFESRYQKALHEAARKTRKGDA